MKVLLIAFFDWQGVVYLEFTLNGQTIIKEYYLDVLGRLREAIRRSGQFCGVTTLGCYTMIMNQHTDNLLFLIS